ncbi:MAG: WD40/YVTN/BNR-like repeat-containing protein, partial [Terriglobia bacterium]
ERDWYFGHVVVDPHSAGVVYVPDVALYRSEDGGKTFIPLKGAPGGDDYHTLWINPEDPRRMIVASDQGTVISVDGGETWTSWYNQPTAQFYHVTVDHQFPFRVYGAQQDSGSASVTSRSDLGEISYRDWYSVGAGESGYIAPDPLDPNIVFGGDNYGALFRFDKRTGQAQDISPCPIARSVANSIASEKCRFTWTSPLVFSPENPHILYFGSQFVMQTTDGGGSWTKISPDLTQVSGPASREPARGVVYTIAPSPAAPGEIWAGTDNGLIQLTRDGGKTWQNVTPPGLPAWSKISLIEASHFDAAVAYAAVDRHRINDFKPYIYRTADYGKTWSSITNGIEAPAYVHAVREDPVRKGLLYAGTETGVYVSFDDGAHWESLQLNLPTASIRDLAIADNDLVAATHGRSFWILDDLTPLRQLSTETLDSGVYLFKPENAVRVRRDVNRDTPLPLETPVGQNPPNGAIIDYYLKSSLQGEVTLEILDPQSKIVRKFVSGQQPRPFPTLLRFSYSWLRHPRPLTKHPGMNRFVWNLRYPSPPALSHDYSIAAVIGRNTPALPQGPLVLPGIYTVRLIVAGRHYDQSLNVRMDPRVATPASGLQKQFDLALRISQGLSQDDEAYMEIRSLEPQLKKAEDTLASNRRARQAAAAVKDLGQKAAEIENGAHGNGGIEGLGQLNADLASLETTVESADAAPTAQCARAATRRLAALKAQLARWNQLTSTTLPSLNLRLRNYGIVPLVPRGD